MKFLVAFVAIVAVASASLSRPVDQSAEFEAILAAINSPSTDPATAAMLQEQLEQTIAAILNPTPIAVGPAIVDSFEPIAVGPAIIDSFEPIAVGPAIVDSFEPIAVGPAIIDFPLPDGGAVSAVEPSPVAVAPVAVTPVQEASSPLVQIILNIQSNSDASPVAVEGSPAVDAPVVPVSPVQVVDVNPVAPEIVSPVIVAPEIVAPEIVSPVQVVESAPTPVQVVDFVPETVAVAAPIISAPAVSLPDTLN